MTTNPKVWFVTGASKGLGLTLVRQLLAAGYAVAATSRNLAELTQAVSAAPERFLPLHMDLGSEASVQQAIDATIGTLGGLDVVVNNAGYGQIGGLEELSDQAGLTESYAAEVQGFNIRATVVYPGYFRTEFLSTGSLGTPKNPIAAYQAIRDSQAAHEQQINGNQPGDPVKAAKLLIQVSEAENPPVHLFLGEDAYQLAAQQIATVQQDLQQWQAMATATSFAIEA